MISGADHLAMGLAKAVVEDSLCVGRVVGCVLLGKNGEIVASGTNKLPHGCTHHDDRLVAPSKYQWVEHAERSAVYSAARSGVPTNGATAYSTLFPCCDCARALIESGITRVVSYAPDFADPRWGDQFKVSLTMFEEAGVAVDFMDGE